MKLSFPEKAPFDFDVVCLSHLRWNFVYQRPQHLLSRFARNRRVFFFEEPEYLDEVSVPYLSNQVSSEGVIVSTPKLPRSLQGTRHNMVERRLLSEMLLEQKSDDFLLWYYTPMALEFSDHLNPRAIIYDCMDELSAFKNAPAVLAERERQLMRRADVVFTGGMRLYEAKKTLHKHVYPFPSSIDVKHFVKARTAVQCPGDQSNIPSPRLGFFGVIDERMDYDLLSKVAEARPDWHIVLIGPFAKVDPAELPRHPNIHYLGKKNYSELPDYIAGWDVALLPFAQNPSTEFISPTKTPEYLAAGKPVVSTPIHDVIHPYGDKNLVSIATDASGFVEAIETILKENRSEQWKRAVDNHLAQMSWDKTWNSMMEVVCDRIVSLDASSNRFGVDFAFANFSTEART